jgi:flagellar hook protein FlgE
MMRSFSSAVSGMRTQMAFMDTVANNIANVSTTAFKASRARFADMFYQTLNNGDGPGDDLGGINPTQIGLGVRLSGVDTFMTQGALRATGEPLDLGIEGEGFFAVTDGTNTYYTRDGAFNFDAEGNFVSRATGMKVLSADGEPITVDDLDQYSAVSVGPDGMIKGVLADGSGTEEIGGPIGIATFPNPGGLTKSGDNLYRASAASGEASDMTDTDRAVGIIRAGVLEGSNVDLAQEFSNMISAQRGFQANSRVISTSDEILGDLVNIKR